MAVVPPFEIGADTSVLTVYKQTRASDGTLSNDTGFGNLSLYSTVDSSRAALRNRTVNISPMTLVQENNVIVEKGASMTFVGKVLRTGTNPARKLANGAEYCIATWTEGAATWTFTGVVESYEQDTNKEGSTYTLSLRHAATVDVGGAPIANPAFTGTV